MKIVVIGLGKIGLPLAAQFADRDHEVVGVDIDARTVDSINDSVEPFPGEANLADYLARLVPAGRLRATTSYADAVPGADAVVVVVPLFVDSEDQPDFGWMDAATAELAQHLTPGTLVAYETTLPVGTTRTRWRPALESGSGLSEGTDFHLVFSPERVLTGRVFADLRRYPKLVGGLSPEGAARAVEFYESVLEFDERPDLERGNGVWDLGTAEAAEMTKLAETTYRDVNIGLANQFAMFAEHAGLDIRKVIEAANSQPYSAIHSPGISVGGHCIPVYPRLYLFTDPAATIVSAARTANAGMPQIAVNRLIEETAKKPPKSVAIFGVAYRNGVKETAFSGAFDLTEQLARRNIEVFVHDPLYTDSELRDLGWTPLAPDQTVDAIVVHTAHEEYETIQNHIGLDGTVLDGRNVVRRVPPGVTLLSLGEANEKNHASSEP